MQLVGENMLTTFETLWTGERFRIRQDDTETFIKILVFRNVREIGGSLCCVDVNAIAITGSRAGEFFPWFNADDQVYLVT